MDEDIIEQAIAWHQALQRDDADWDAYVLWLEADVRHRTVYDEIALLDDMIDRNRDRLTVILKSRTA